MSVNRKIKVAFFAEHLYGGGVERILQIILKNFDFDKYDVTLYSSHHETLDSEFYPLTLKRGFMFLSSGNSLWTRMWCKLNNKLRLWVYYHCRPSVFYKMFIRKKYDVGIAFIEGYATRFLAGAPESMKKIAWLHIELDNFHWTDVAYQDRAEEVDCYAKMDRIVCVSQVVKQQADRLFKRSDETLVLHNPIDVNMICERALEPLNNEYSSKKHEFRIVSIGTLNARKSFDRLLDAVYMLIQEGLDIELLILGDGEEKQRLLDYISNQNLEARVKLVGFKNNPFPYLKSADVYVCSSKAEGYNTAVSEALVLGVPVVSTEVSGIREQLGENSEIGVIAENSTKGIYQGLKQILNTEALSYYRQKSAACQNKFSLETQMNKIYELINN